MYLVVHNRHPVAHPGANTYNYSVAVTVMVCIQQDIKCGLLTQ